MQIAYHEVELELILELYSRGFKVKPEDKVVKYETFIDGNQGKVIYKLFIQQAWMRRAFPFLVSFLLFVQVASLLHEQVVCARLYLDAGFAVRVFAL